MKAITISAKSKLGRMLLDTVRIGDSAGTDENIKALRKMQEDLGFELSVRAREYGWR